MAPKRARWLHNPCRLGGPNRFRAGGRIRVGPQVGKVATYALPPWGSPALPRGGQNLRWPRSGQAGYITPPAWGVPTASERGAESEVAHKWARGLDNPCRLGGHHRFTSVGIIRGGPQAGKVATWPLPPRGSPPLQSGTQNRRWPTSGQCGYLTPAAWGSPPLKSRERNQKWPTSGQGGYMTPTAWLVPTISDRGEGSQLAHKGARWLQNPFRLGGAHRFGAVHIFISGAQVAKVAT